MNRDKLLLEVEKLREEKQLRYENLELLAERREVVGEELNLIKRLNETPLLLEDIEIKSVELDDKEGLSQMSSLLQVSLQSQKLQAHSPSLWFQFEFCLWFRVGGQYRLLLQRNAGLPSSLKHRPS